MNQFTKRGPIETKHTLVVKNARPSRNDKCPCGIKCKNCPKHRKFLDKRYKIAK